MLLTKKNYHQKLKKNFLIQMIRKNGKFHSLGNSMEIATQGISQNATDEENKRNLELVFHEEKLKSETQNNVSVQFPSLSPANTDFLKLCCNLVEENEKLNFIV